MKMKQKNILSFSSFVILFSFFVINMNAQVTIGSNETPDGNVLLDLKQNASGLSNKGFLPPRVALVATDSVAPLTGTVLEGTLVYNTATSVNPAAPNAISPGLYYYKGGWVKVQQAATTWFYMPSIVIDVSKDGPGTRDLWLEYRKQFGDDQNPTHRTGSMEDGTALVKSETGAPNPFTRLFEETELYYYVTGYDTKVFKNVNITNHGILTYTVVADEVTEATYMNIVFMVK
jgi:hypothetical protein